MKQCNFKNNNNKNYHVFIFTLLNGVEFILSDEIHVAVLNLCVRHHLLARSVGLRASRAAIWLDLHYCSLLQLQVLPLPANCYIELTSAIDS